MNKRLYFLLLPLLFFVSVSVVRAEDSTKSGTTTRQIAREDLREKRQEMQQEFKSRVQTARDDWATRAAALKLRISEIKDERKQKTVENIDERIVNRNELWATHWNAVLTRLTQILDKISTRAQTASSNGKDISSITTAVTAAKDAIAAAQEKVNTQAGKTYTINIASESTLGSAVSSTLKTFHSDVEGVITSINTARKAVSDALSALAKVSGSQNK